jgi:molybdenum cofactor guanylyltransferase
MADVVILKGTLMSRDKHKGDNKGGSQKGFKFNPSEIAFSGYSGSGKTTLIEKLIRQLSQEYQVGFVKSDVHGFKMDIAEKDTWRATEAGASGVYIQDKNHFALLRSGTPSDQLQQSAFLDDDFVLVEGYRKSDMRKFIFSDSLDVELVDHSNLVGCITADKDSTEGLVRVGNVDSEVFLKSFGRDDSDKIVGKIKALIDEDVKNRPLLGLVLTGGKSSRMGKDKAELEYHGISQTEHSYNLLAKFCDKVYVSSRSDQANTTSRKKYNQIHDRFIDFGPLGGILSAMMKEPQAAWLVLGCDLPFVDEPAIRNLVTQRDGLRFATAYKSSFDGFPEPLCTIYEPKARFRMMAYLAAGKLCPRKTLINSRIKLLDSNSESTLDNINNASEFCSARKRVLEKK